MSEHQTTKADKLRAIIHRVKYSGALDLTAHERDEITSALEERLLYVEVLEAPPHGE